jgi:hypothetical protein
MSSTSKVSFRLHAESLPLLPKRLRSFVEVSITGVVKHACLQAQGVGVRLGAEWEILTLWALAPIILCVVLVGREIVTITFDF